ncbi:hypothetical protein M0P65_05290 [Candidatus Gracilibacteria bacterium]|nr:hypothetical protein [Candidatus Gracilibacteria bacterium]
MAKLNFVINQCYGGFGISELAAKRMVELGFKIKEKNNKYYEEGKWSLSDAVSYDLERDNPYLIKAIYQLGNKANGDLSKLAIVQVDFNVEKLIHENDGYEVSSDGYIIFSTAED